jgi:hypothetical protein
MTHHTHGHGHAHTHGTVDRREDPVARDAAQGRIVFLDAQSGVSGDMLVAALIDVGVPFEVVREAVDALGLGGFRVSLETRVRSGIAARGFAVAVEGEHPERSWREIRGLIGASRLDTPVKDIAIAAFGRLADAEARVHGVSEDDVVFHEVGAIDSIVDVVAAAAAFAHLGGRIVCSPLPMGRGTVHARHGALPLPAPATVYCLRGVPTYDGGVAAELVTPTGACLVATVARDFARWPSMRPERIGWGAGTRELPDRANVLRVVVGEPVTSEPATEDGAFVVLETNVDDSSAEIVAHAVSVLLSAGALDAWTVPIGMKKGRPAVMLCALARRAEKESLARVLLAETSTLGVRVRGVDRIERPRRIVNVATRFGQIPVKLADGDGLPRHVAPEFDACRDAAHAHGVSAKEVYAAALRAADDV